MNQFKDVFASEEEIISMTSSVADYCRLSGCNLLEILYGINESVEDGKRHFTTDSIIELFNEHLERLAENDNPDQEEEIEKEFIDLVIKKIEKIAALHKPDSFKAMVLGRVNLEQAIEEVEQKTHGLSNLMKSKTRDRLFSIQANYESFAEKADLYASQDKFAEDFKEQEKKRS